ncbi:cytochrome P450 [Aspergillus heterothallicus]
MVRIGPNHVSISDPAAIPMIYGITSKFLKSDFYIPFAAKHEGTPLDTLFSTRDPSFHKYLKVPVAQKYSMTTIRQFEPMADECTALFFEAMHDLEGQKVDFGAWLQWYAFDVIAAMTFQARFGFMEKRKDVHGMIASIEKALMYGAMIGQVPGLHKWLLGNNLWLWILRNLFPNVPNPIVHIINITLREMERYEQDNAQKERTDFLALIRADMDAGKNTFTDRDILNHLSDNLDTTGISLRAIFYYLMKNPATYQKLISEIDEAQAQGKLSDFITCSESLQLPYLQAVMKEALRLHPGVQMLLERVVPEGGATVCGTYLSAGTIVGINPVVIHYSKEVFGSDVNSFRPERWLEASAEQLKLMDRSFFAFGHGSRTCIGKNISLLEMGKLVPQILREFDVEWASDNPEWSIKTYFFAKQDDFFTRLRTRRK